MGLDIVFVHILRGPWLVFRLLAFLITNGVVISVQQQRLQGSAAHCTDLLWNYDSTKVLNL